MQWYTVVLLIVAGSTAFVAAFTVVLAATLWLTNAQTFIKHRPRTSRRP
jgi:hypothetical protein